jgi:hypothetical protein
VDVAQERLLETRNKRNETSVIAGSLCFTLSTPSTTRYAASVKRAVIRLPVELLVRLDKLVTRLSAARPGRRFSRASVVRALLSTGLGLVETRGARFGGVLVGRGLDLARPEAARRRPRRLRRLRRLRAARPRVKTTG